MYIAQVNVRWREAVSTAQSFVIHRLNLGQFWSRLGVLDGRHFAQLVQRYRSVTDLNLSYCHFLTGTMLQQLVQALPQCERLERLSLFYCYSLTDDAVIALLPSLPALTDLNVGRCIHLTDRTTRSLYALPNLRSLTLTSLPKLSEESLMLFDDPNFLHSLHTLVLVNVGKFSAVEVDELRGSRQGWKVIGPEEQHVNVERNGKRKETRKDINDT